MSPTGTPLHQDLWYAYSGSIARHRHYPWGGTTIGNTTSCVACRGLSPRSNRRLPANPEELVLGRLELAHVAPVLPGHAAPQRPVDAVLVHVPASATAGVPYGVAEFGLQFGVVPVLRAARRGECLRVVAVHFGDRLGHI